VKDVSNVLTKDGMWTRIWWLNGLIIEKVKALFDPFTKRIAERFTRHAMTGHRLFADWTVAPKNKRLWIITEKRFEALNELKGRNLNADIHSSMTMNECSFVCCESSIAALFTTVARIEAKELQKLFDCQIIVRVKVNDLHLEWDALLSSVSAAQRMEIDKALITKGKQRR